MKYTSRLICTVFHSQHDEEVVGHQLGLSKGYGTWLNIIFLYHTCHIFFVDKCPVFDFHPMSTISQIWRFP